jgi:molybdopterin-guanine dinucleotide biosynthesis adapter protein
MKPRECAFFIKPSSQVEGISEMNSGSRKIFPKKNGVPVVAIVGSSGTGKTTLIEKLIPVLRKKGFRVGTIKHDVHGFSIDQPGKDSWRHKEAGASMVLLSSPRQVAMVKDVAHDTPLDELVSYFSGVDIILAEGYKRGDRPKLEVFRPEIHDKPVCGNDRNLLGMVSDAPVDCGVPRFLLNDVEGIAALIISRFDLAIPERGTRKEAAS